VGDDVGRAAGLRESRGRHSTAEAEETVISVPAEPAIVLGADKAAGTVTALIIGTGSAAVVSISPPRTCWS
jgi:hypothetical protein